MKVGRIPPGEERGTCHSCHNRAIIEVELGTQRPILRLCAKCTKYLGDFLHRRLAEYEARAPIPTPRAGRSDNWGNR
jgi:hypothetical protein